MVCNKEEVILVCGDLQMINVAVTSGHIWEILGNYPVSTMVMVIYHYVERICRIIVTLDFTYNIYDHE